jgi:aspartate aminotransferase-like enzyme
MKDILLTPGPTPIPPSVLSAMARPIIHHRTKEFGALFDFVINELKTVYRTKNDVVMMTSSGTGAMESAVVNLLTPGDKTLVYTTGAFGDRFVDLHKTYGLSPVVIAEEWGSAALPQKLEAALKANPGLKAVFFQHTDTSTGILNDIEALAKTVRQIQPEALIVIDAVSSLAAERLETDAWGLDVVLSASQKGLMAPPGLAFAAVSARAWKAVESAKLPRFYLNWLTMRKSLKDKETPFTPAISLVAAQAEALKIIAAEGIENVWKRTTGLAQYTRAWAQRQGLPLFAKDPAHILTALKLPADVDGQKLIGDILREEGISIAGGQVHLKGKIIRIAHMGFIGKADLDAGFAALEKRLGVKAGH